MQNVRWSAKRVNKPLTFYVSLTKEQSTLLEQAKTKSTTFALWNIILLIQIANLKVRFGDNEKVNISILKLNIFRFYLFTVKFVSEILF